MTKTSPVTVLPKSAAATPFDAALALKQVIDAAQQYLETREQEITKRAQIAAWESVTLAEIAAKEQIFLTYLTRSFDERERNFAELFQALDKAMASGTGDVAHILGAITTLAAKSPFNDLHDIELVKNALNDPDHEWTV
jgi:hypothetical protein